MNVNTPPPNIKYLEQEMSCVADELTKSALRCKALMDAMYSNQTEVATVDLVKMWFIEQRRFEQIVQRLRDLAAGQTPY